MGKDQFGNGGTRRIPASKIKRAKNPPPPKKKGCDCSYVAAGKAITRMQFRLAVRFVRMDLKSRMGLI